MIALCVFFASLLMTPSPARDCEELGPRLDGTYVTVCHGSVVRVRDGFGNVRDWDPATRRFTIRSSDKAPMVLE